MSKTKIEVSVDRNEVHAYHERPVTKAEHKRDKEATIMAENVTIKFFADRKPKIVIDRTLCEE